MTTSWEDVHFLSHVNIKNIIGKELINDDNVAVMELVKNSYDAGALQVDVEFKNLTSLEKFNHELVISDDGQGMSKEDILHKWLNLAYSIKRVQNAQNNRLQAGNKGIGRFSCDRLGKKLNIFTKKNEGKIYQLQISWEDFENIEDYSVEINQIPMKLREVNKDIVFEKTGYKINNSGTIIQILNLRTKWIEINEDSLFNDVLNYQKFSTLKASLEKLINKSQVDSGGFKIFLHAKEIDDSNENSYYKKINGEVKNNFFNKLNFDTTYIQSAISEDGSQIITKLKDRDKVVFQTIEKNIEFPDLKGIKIILMYLNPYAKVYFEKQMGMRSVEFGSVFLFINGFRIPPYGDVDNDAFGMEVRKNQGRNRYLSNREIIGRIEIEDRENQYKVISSREGIVQNEKFKQLIHKSTKSKTNQRKNNGFFYKTLKKLENYVVKGIRWDSVPKLYTESYIKDLLTSDGWNNKQEVYLIPEEEKKKNIGKNIFKILGIETTYIQNLHIDVKLLSSLLEEKEQLEVEKNIVKFLKDFAKLPHDVIDDKLKLFTKKITKKIDDVKLVKKVEFVLSNKDRNKLIDEAIDNDILYNELDKKIEILESEKDTLKKQKEQKDKQILFLQSIQPIEKTELIKLQHHIGLYAETIEDTILDFKMTLDETDNISKEEVIAYLTDISLEAQKILAINKYATKANFLSKSQSINADIIRFISEYIENIYKLNTNKDLTINVNTINLTYLCKFEPLIITIIIDNLLNNSKKANAKNVNIIFKKEDDLIVEYIDDGNGLHSSIINPSDIFEIGITTTSGSGLGLHHIKESLQRMKNSTIKVVKMDNGIKFIIRFKI